MEHTNINTPQFKESKSSSTVITLSIISFVFAGIAFFVALVPCFNFFAIIPAIIASLLAIIGFFVSLGCGKSLTIGSISLLVSIAIGYFSYSKISSNVESLTNHSAKIDKRTDEVKPYKDYPTCDSLINDYERVFYLFKEEVDADSSNEELSVIESFGAFHSYAHYDAMLKDMEKEEKRLECDCDSLYLIKKAEVDSLYDVFNME